MGDGYFEVDTGRAGRGGLPFEDALANGSARPALFPRTKQPSACGQLEGRLGTQNDRGHSAGPFILPPDPMGPPRPWRPSLPSAAQPFESVQEFRGAFRALHNFYSRPPSLLILPSSGGKNAVSQPAQTTYSVVKIVNNERERERCTMRNERERRWKRKIKKKGRKKKRSLMGWAVDRPMCVSPAVDHELTTA